MSEVNGDDVVSSYDTGKIQPITSSYSTFKRTFAFCTGMLWESYVNSNHDLDTE